MPPKRAKNKSKAHRKTEKGDNDAKEVKEVVLDHKILLNPAFRLEEIIERGSAATMKRWSTIVTENLNWLQSQKAALKEIIRNAGAPENSGSKTPRRGAAAFARLRETADSYTSHSLAFEDREVEQENGENGQEFQTTSQACTATVAVNNDVVEADGEMQSSSQAQVEPPSLHAQPEEFFEVEPQQMEAEFESSYEDAHNSIHQETPANHEEPEQEFGAAVQQHNVEDSTCTTETYVSAKGSAERLPQSEYITHVKEECVTPPEPQLVLQKTLCPSTSGETASNSE